jgi:hypothetical protein
VRLRFVVVSLLVVLLVYAALYWVSLAIPRSFITYWASVKTTGLRPILNCKMLIIWLTSPFNAYESLMFHYPPWLYFIDTVVMPTVILALILMPVLKLCRKGMAGCETVGRSFLTHSFALAIATSYITSLITWLTLGKPGIDMSIYTEFMLASAAYVALYLTATLLRRPRPLRYLPMRCVIVILSIIVGTIVIVIIYLIYFLSLTLPHLIGLIPIIILIGYLTRHIGQARLIFWIAGVLFVIGLDIYLYYLKIFGPEVFTGVLIAVVTIAPFTYRRWIAVPILRIEVPKEGVIRKPILVTLNLPQACICQPYQEVGYLRLRVRNTGLAAARGCVFQVRIVGWPSNCPANCHAPSDEYVDWQDVTWADRLLSIVIRPNDVRYANIAMMPLQNARACLPAPWQCDNQVNPCGPIIAWIAKREIFDPRLGCAARLQDGLVAGEYVIDVQVTCRNGRKKPERLRLRISQDWNTTDISQ